MLATLLSTPCTAPFLGTALTFAFLSSTATLFLVFIFIGIGLAFPFIVTIFYPHLVHMLPRPGVWMEHFKKFLGLTLILSIVWLADVLSALVTVGHVSMKVNGAVVMLFFAFYMRKHITKKKIWQFLAFAIPLFVILHIFFGANRFLDIDRDSALKWERWSEEKMAIYQEQKETVFISFTADWCLTCKVNESMFINTSGFKDIVKKHRLKLLQGDLTRSDEKITNFLKKNGLIGIPAYFIQKSDGTLINLRETITLGKIRRNLK